MIAAVGVHPSASPDSGPGPKVSVLLTTYNHERFIAQSLEGVLAQQTEFPFEIIVGEDCSEDRTRRIVQYYVARPSGRIGAVLPSRNLGAGGKRLFLETIRASRGRYIAFLDGDDYWTAPHKLLSRGGDGRLPLTGRGRVVQPQRHGSAGEDRAVSPGAEPRAGSSL